MMILLLNIADVVIIWCAQYVLWIHL